MTSIEFLQDCLQIHLTYEQQMQFEGLFQQAKEMEKQQIIEAYCQGAFDIRKKDDIFPRETSEQYYNETFNK